MKPTTTVLVCTAALAALMTAATPAQAGEPALRHASHIFDHLRKTGLVHLHKKGLGDVLYRDDDDDDGGRGKRRKWRDDDDDDGGRRRRNDDDD